MHSPARLRLVGGRACVLGGVATAAGAVGHVHAAGGQAPGLPPLLVSWLLASVVSALFLGRQVGWALLSALLLGEQLGVHAGLMLWATPSASSMPGMADMPGMAMPMPAMSAIPSPAMVGAHLGAAVLAGLWLWRGERALSTLLGLVAGTIQLLWCRAVVGPPSPVARMNVCFDLQSWWEVHLARGMPRRGPPACAAL
ncbi:MAG: hypothetical protein ACTHOG_04810 [Marmoricola sp.]